MVSSLEINEPYVKKFSIYSREEKEVKESQIISGTIHSGYCLGGSVIGSIVKKL